MDCLTPTPLKRNRSIYESSILPTLLQQESQHAASKRPRISFATEADQKIQGIFTQVQEVRSRVTSIGKNINTLELKVDLLEIERDQHQKHHMIHQLSFPLTPKGSARSDQSPCERRFLEHFDLQSPAAVMNMSPRVIDYLRKRRLLENYLNRSWAKVKTEQEGLEEIFRSNFNLLKFKRAEKCLLGMIKLQRKIKNLQEGYFQLRDRLLQISDEL